MKKNGEKLEPSLSFANFRMTLVIFLFWSWIAAITKLLHVIQIVYNFQFIKYIIHSYNYVSLPRQLFTLALTKDVILWTLKIYQTFLGIYPRKHRTSFFFFDNENTEHLDHSAVNIFIIIIVIILSRFSFFLWEGFLSSPHFNF